jgi:hypothetical protein
MLKDLRIPGVENKPQAHGLRTTGPKGTSPEGETGVFLIEIEKTRHFLPVFDK